MSEVDSMMDGFARFVRGPMTFSRTMNGSPELRALLGFPGPPSRCTLAAQRRIRTGQLRERRRAARRARRRTS